MFGRYAYPPNELGYCGPTDGGGTSGLASHAKEFDGAWPYLTAIADAVGASDPLDEDVVSSYWVGGPALYKVDPAELLARLRAAFKGQVTGLLDAVPATAEVLAHHSFHVFVVYPWVRFLRRDAATAVQVMQDCRIRWGTVESVAGEHAVISSSPLQLDDGRLILGEPQHRDRPVEEGRRVAGARADARDDRLRALGLGVRNAHRRRGRRAGGGDSGHAGPGQRLLRKRFRCGGIGAHWWFDGRSLMTITAQPGGSYIDADLSADLAAAALDMARRFHDGATLWVISPQWEPHAHHVAVEFVHPVIMGKRALPSVALVEPDPVAQARVASRPGDLLIAVASADEPAVVDAMRRAQAWGVLTLWIGSGSAPAGGRCESHSLDRLRRPDGAGHGNVRADVPPAVGAHPRLLRASRSAEARTPTSAPTKCA